MEVINTPNSALLFLLLSMTTCSPTVFIGSGNVIASSGIPSAGSPKITLATSFSCTGLKRPTLFRGADAQRNFFAAQGRNFIIQLLLLLRLLRLVLGARSLKLRFLFRRSRLGELFREQAVDGVPVGDVLNLAMHPHPPNIFEQNYFHCVMSHVTAASFWGSLPALTSSAVRSALMSGLRPPSEMDCPLGVSQRAMVTLSSAPPPSCMSCCTDPLPKLRVPTSLATPCCWSAPAKSSSPSAPPRRGSRPDCRAGRG